VLFALFQNTSVLLMFELTGFETGALLAETFICVFKKHK